MPDTQQAGYDSKLYVNATLLTADPEVVITDAHAGWKEVSLAKDISEPDERNKIEWENRKGWQIGGVGSRRYAVEFEATYDSDDPAIVILEAAYIAGTAIAVAMMDEAITTGNGMWANVKIVSFSKSNPMAGDRSVSVTTVLDGKGHYTQTNP